MVCPDTESGLGGGGPGIAVLNGVAGGGEKYSSDACRGFVRRNTSPASASFGLGRFALGADSVRVRVGGGIGSSALSA